MASIRAHHPPLTPEESTRALARVPPPLPLASHRLTPGRVLYLLWHRPRQLLKRENRYLWERARVQRAMRAAERALRFPEQGPRTGPPLEISFLVGINYVPQCLFAMKSWLRHAGRPTSFRCHDDGSLPASATRRLGRPPVGVTIDSAAEIHARLDRALPEAEFPVLRALRRGFPHLGKLTDVYAGRDGWRCVADADIVIQRPPRDLLACYDARTPFYFVDTVESYGFPRAELGALTGCPLPERVNSGCFGFDAAKIDWHFLEWAAGRVLAHLGFSFYLEQSLVAMLMGRLGGQALGADYIVGPTREEAERPTATALHFLNGAHNPDLLRNWRHLQD